MLVIGNSSDYDEYTIVICIHKLIFDIFYNKPTPTVQIYIDYINIIYINRINKGFERSARRG